jgi:hypothetical protein
MLLMDAVALKKADFDTFPCPLSLLGSTGHQLPPPGGLLDQNLYTLTLALLTDGILQGEMTDRPS